MDLQPVRWSRLTLAAMLVNGNSNDVKNKATEQTSIMSNAQAISLKKN